ncbi:hypothetical protein LJC48_03005 [Desulfovibrio sp. OttesenSCG-928-C06]|nr:hypothetical protein [Desulfovibrio sp. OttesenSCG-928-C06]
MDMPKTRNNEERLTCDTSAINDSTKDKDPVGILFEQVLLQSYAYKKAFRARCQDVDVYAQHFDALADLLKDFEGYQIEPPVPARNADSSGFAGKL